MEDVNKELLIERVLETSEKAFLKMTPLMSQEWLNLSLTMSQLRVLSILSNNESVRMSVIASDLGVSLPAVTGVVDNLVEQGMVVRLDQPGDRRVVLCALSEKGQKLMSRMWRVYQDQHREMLNELDIYQLQLLNAAIELVMQTQLAMKSKLQRRQNLALNEEQR